MITSFVFCLLLLKATTSIHYQDKYREHVRICSIQDLYEKGFSSSYISQEWNEHNFTSRKAAELLINLPPEVSEDIVH